MLLLCSAPNWTLPRRSPPPALAQAHSFIQWGPVLALLLDTFLLQSALPSVSRSCGHAGQGCHACPPPAGTRGMEILWVVVVVVGVGAGRTWGPGMQPASEGLARVGVTPGGRFVRRSSAMHPAPARWVWAPPAWAGVVLVGGKRGCSPLWVWLALPRDLQSPGRCQPAMHASSCVVYQQA